MASSQHSLAYLAYQMRQALGQTSYSDLGSQSWPRYISLLQRLLVEYLPEVLED